MLNSRHPVPEEDWDGVLPVDKPAGCTSFDVVRRLKHHFSPGKIGHSGTLDPAATGLMLILLGKSTKLSGVLTGLDKDYEGVFKLGEETDTQDGDGTVIFSGSTENLTPSFIETEMAARRGDQYQTPPMFSAKKINGIPLYKLARRGKTVERKPQFITLHAFELKAFNPPFVSFRLHCSKGTYVRTVVSDLGRNLGCGAHLTALRRTAIGGFNVMGAHELQKLLETSSAEIRRHLRTIPLSTVPVI
jgi:tRNA pseudouridine55 synthase